MTPLIDVIFQLLVFFMITSSFTYPALQLELPKAEAEDDSNPPQSFVLSQDNSGKLFLNRKSVSMEQLVPELVAAFAGQEDPIVYFRGDKDMPYARFVDLMQATGQAGAAGFYLLHEPEQK
jgi:biopolymer transport protein ExbD